MNSRAWSRLDTLDASGCWLTDEGVSRLFWSSYPALADLDLIAEGTNGLTTAVDKVKGDVTDLRAAASSATSGSVDNLQTAVDQLSTAVSNLSGAITASSLPALKTAITNVSSSATAVYDTLKDCP